MAYDKFGLRELTRDDRDFSLGAFTVLPSLEELPKEYKMNLPFEAKDQGNTDFCSAYSSCGVSELQEGIELVPEYSFAGSKKLSGDVDAWGQNLRDACKTHQKHGALPVEVAPKSLKLLSNDKKRQWRWYEQLLPKALPQRKKSYFSVTGNYDSYDNIRATIWKYRKENRAVMIGVIFSWNLEQYILDNPQDQGYGHAMYVCGWTEKGLYVRNSYGNKAGEKGLHIVTRDVINEFVPRFGAYMFMDIEKEEAKKLLDREVVTRGSFWARIKVLLTNYWHEIWR